MKYNDLEIWLMATKFVNRRTNVQYTIELYKPCITLTRSPYGPFNPGLKYFFTHCTPVYNDIQKVVVIFNYKSTRKKLFHEQIMFLSDGQNDLTPIKYLSNNNSFVEVYTYKSFDMKYLRKNINNVRFSRERGLYIESHS